METPCLTDKAEYPDDEVLARHLGKSKNAWDSFIGLMKKNYPSFTSEWRYYNDGKRWLFKITKKAKTVCWVSVWDNRFKTTFYFSDKAEDLVKNSKLNKEFKDQFIHGKKYGKIRGITVDVQKTTDLETVKILIEIKEKIK
jgi:hypothetical protein